MPSPASQPPNPQSRDTEPRALITGITGQDGSYLAELLLHKGYRVFGLVRRTSRPSYERITSILPQLQLITGDLLDQSSLVRALQESKPTEVYNLAAQSFVKTSFSEPVATAEVTGLGAARLLEALRQVAPDARYYQASTSEMFGEIPGPQSEHTSFHPRSPYGVAKLYAHWSTINTREAYGTWAVSGILFNHESPRRGPEFVTRKVTQAVARIYLGLDQELVLGNLDARRDWGHARDYVWAMWAMLQMDEPRDLVIGSGQAHSVRDLVSRAFAVLDLDWEKYVRTDPAFLRPAEVHDLVADAGQAREILGWQPRTDFDSLIREMVAADLEVESGAAGSPPMPLGSPPLRR